MILPLYLEELRIAIPRSREQATSVAALAALLGRTDREIRDQIKDLRELYRVPVMALPVRNGVWITNDPVEVEMLIALQTSRARSIERSVQVLRQVRDAMQYSPALF